MNETQWEALHCEKPFQGRKQRRKSYFLILQKKLQHQVLRGKGVSARLSKVTEVGAAESRAVQRSAVCNESSSGAGQNQQQGSVTWLVRSGHGAAAALPPGRAKEHSGLHK